MKRQKLVAFDLDGTLTKSKQMMSLRVAHYLKELAKYSYVAIVSGASESQFKKQVLPILRAVEFPFEKLFLITTNGGRVIYYLDGNYNIMYPTYELTLQEKSLIRDVILKTFDRLEWSGDITKYYGKQIEDRNTQVTFSALGQDAPLELKQEFDPEQIKRTELRDIVAEELPDFDVKIGGTTSIDVTMRGVSKVSGLLQVMNVLALPMEDVIYFGDALYPGGNDRCVKDAGFYCVDTQGPFEAVAAMGRLIYPFLYVQPEGEKEYPSLWRVRYKCVDHIWKFPGGDTPTKICLGCGIPKK